MPDFKLLIQETGDLNWSFLTLLSHLRSAAYLAARLLFLVLILSFADFFCKLSTYSSETTRDKFYTVNDATRGDDLSYGACKKVQERPESAFSAKDENIISRTAIDLVPQT